MNRIIKIHELLYSWFIHECFLFSIYLHHNIRVKLRQSLEYILFIFILCYFVQIFSNIFNIFNIFKYFVQINFAQNDLLNNEMHISFCWKSIYQFWQFISIIVPGGKCSPSLLIQSQFDISMQRPSATEKYIIEEWEGVSVEIFFFEIKRFLNIGSKLFYFKCR